MQPIWSLGMMSGTSLDGVDAAMLRTDGVDHLEFGPTQYHGYGEAHRAVLRAEMTAQAKGEATAAGSDAVARAVIAEHQRALSNFAQTPDVIGFHGQTVFHDPAEGKTVQLGDGATLADRPVVWDFRTRDIEQGGEGAPLAPFFHHALARHAKLTAPVAFLNLGGVGNVTWVNPAITAPEVPEALLAFDTGPANALVDDFVKLRTGAAFDEDGRLAAFGQVDEDILRRALGHRYFSVKPPKSLDRDSFAPLLLEVEGLNTQDGVATLTAFTAASVALSLRWFPTPVEHMFVCGGGRHNATLMAALTQATGTRLAPVESLDLDGDMLEAQAFAYLAVRVLRGLPTSSPTTTGCFAPVSGGQISGYFPSSDV